MTLVTINLSIDVTCLCVHVLVEVLARIVLYSTVHVYIVVIMIIIFWIQRVILSIKCWVDDNFFGRKILNISLGLSFRVRY